MTSVQLQLLVLQTVQSVCRIFYAVFFAVETNIGHVNTTDHDQYDKYLDRKSNGGGDDDDEEEEGRTKTLFKNCHFYPDAIFFLLLKFLD